MTLRVAIAAAAVFVAAQTASVIAADDDLLGLWQTPDGATVEVVECATGMCGDIVALTERDGVAGEDIRDVNHPNPKNRDRKLVGTRIMRKVVQTGPGEWKGRVYHPKHGLRMAPTLKLLSSGDLELTACLKKAPSVCQSETWTRVN